MKIINGFEIFKVECSAQWGALKPGTTGGMLFRTKRAATAWANAQVSA